MARNAIHFRPATPDRRPGPWVALLTGAMLALPALGQEPIDPADRLPPQLREQLLPSAEPLENEHRVVRSQLAEALPCQGGIRDSILRVWVAGGGVVLDTSQPGLALHYYAQGIKAMTPADKLWERLPKRAATMQQLIDDVIGRSRSTGRTITHLSIAGHAGLPGCSAFGGTIDDCTFRGVLSRYQRDQLARLRPYLGKDAEIELRQCATGSGKAGKRLLTTIYQITGASASSYLADFHFGDSASHPRIRVGPDGVTFINPDD